MLNKSNDTPNATLESDAKEIKQPIETVLIEELMDEDNSETLHEQRMQRAQVIVQDLVSDDEESAEELNLSDIEEDSDEKIKDIVPPQELFISKFTIKHSIFDESIEITQNKWAISFAKQSYESLDKEINYYKDLHGQAPNRRDIRIDPHHAFLILQTPEEIYKIHLVPGKDVWISGEAQVLNPSTRFNSKKTFNDAVKHVLWGKKDFEYAPNTVADIGHKTWSISKEKAIELLIDVQMDQNNPPRFFLGGTTSIFTPNHLITSSIGATGSAYISSTILKRTARGSQMDPKTASSFLVVEACAAGVATFAVTPESVNVVTKSHNCATWAVEKLKNLKISEITESLKSYHSDKIAFFTDLHVYKDEADRDAIKNLVKDIVKEAAKPITKPLNAVILNLQVEFTTYVMFKNPWPKPDKKMVEDYIAKLKEQLATDKPDKNPLEQATFDTLTEKLRVAELIRDYKLESGYLTFHVRNYNRPHPLDIPVSQEALFELEQEIFKSAFKDEASYKEGCSRYTQKVYESARQRYRQSYTKEYVKQGWIDKEQENNSHSSCIIQ